ncbi:Interleukin-27 receptor subunit alpha [Fukomys damarensis]|uniref:Interleukin-27 receptor subunit alpha n=1 Tax=Fukomys damarensis TaxID=885580 RepID=A0A091CPJ7_FUKDA|nr:Interleukin-27 receptor subunit alpha [Fukomys damarensis]
MRGALAASLRPLSLLWLVVVLLPRTCAQGSAGLLQCFRVGPRQDLNCSWEPLRDSGEPVVLHFRSQKYDSNRTRMVEVPVGQSWGTIARKKFTEADQLLVWGTRGGRPLWTPVLVDLETRVKPDAPQLIPGGVDFLEDAPLEATVRWQPPRWPPKALACQFYYQRCPEQSWSLLEPEVETVPLSPVEMQELELTSAYKVRGRCRVEPEGDLWGEWSPAFHFQTPPAAPKDVWIAGNPCATPGSQTALLVWKVSSAPRCLSPGRPQTAQGGRNVVSAAPLQADTGVASGHLGDPGCGPEIRSRKFRVWKRDWRSKACIRGVVGALPLPLRLCSSVSSSTRKVTLPNLPWGPCKFWVTAATIAGQGPPGPSLQFHLPGNTLSWGLLPRILCLWALLQLGCCLGLATSGRCLHLRHKVLPRWVVEKVPDPANSHSGHPHIEVSQPQPQPLGDAPILEVEEMEPLPLMEPPQASTPLHSGYEKHFMPTPEELGLLGSPSPHVLA